MQADCGQSGLPLGVRMGLGTPPTCGSGEEDKYVSPKRNPGYSDGKKIEEMPGNPDMQAALFGLDSLSLSPSELAFLLFQSGWLGGGQGQGVGGWC